MNGEKIPKRKIRISNLNKVSFHDLINGREEE